jgi:hypothetical protein
MEGAMHLLDFLGAVVGVASLTWLLLRWSAA